MTNPCTTSEFHVDYAAIPMTLAWRNLFRGEYRRLRRTYGRLPSRASIEAQLLHIAGVVVRPAPVRTSPLNDFAHLLEAFGS